MPEEKKRISAYVSTKLYTKLVQSKYSMTEAITKCLEMFLELPYEQEDTNTQGNDISLNHELLMSYQARTESLEDQLKVKENDYRERIEDLKEQLKVKDQQLEKKDTQIENLTNAMQSQAINIHDMLNHKVIEAPGAKKPWWKIW